MPSKATPDSAHQRGPAHSTGSGQATPPCSHLRAPAAWRDHAYTVAVDVRVDTSLRHRGSHLGTTAATVEALRAAAGGAVAVFFPSYAYAENVLRALEYSGTVLRTALQPKLPDLAAQAAWVEESLMLADALLLVLGSSFAEGIDLLGGRVTHAMVVGPALPEVNAVQKARLEAFAHLGRNEAFRRVYQIPGLQKVNQALGRLVRGPGQKAKVLLHCRRFADPTYASLLSPEYQMYREVGNESDLQEWLQSPL
jgi:Rad3-related DNA helicase